MGLENSGPISENGDTVFKFLSAEPCCQLIVSVRLLTRSISSVAENSFIPFGFVASSLVHTNESPHLRAAKRHHVSNSLTEHKNRDQRLGGEDRRWGDVVTESRNQYSRVLGTQYPPLRLDHW